MLRWVLVEETGQEVCDMALFMAMLAEPHRQHVCWQWIWCVMVDAAVDELLTYTTAELHKVHATHTKYGQTDDDRFTQGGIGSQCLEHEPTFSQS